MEFSKLDRVFQIKYCTIPQHVSATKNPDDETTKQVIARQDKFITLPDPIRKKLSSSETGAKIEEIGKRYNFQLLQLANIARIIRSYYFGEVRLENFPQMLAEEMDIIPSIAREISNFVIQKIINDNSQQKAYEAQLAKLTLPDALKKYPDLGEQLITSTHINLKSFPEPVRPSVKNWLFDYTFNMGHDSHDSMTRGQYLFRNANAKTLPAADRQKLEYVLKTYDENMIVTVNVNTKQLVFPDLSRSTKHEVRSTEDTNQNILNTKYQIPDTHSEPVDIFQREKENEQKYFSGTVVKNQQWVGLPESRNTKHETRNTEIPNQKNNIVGSMSPDLPVRQTGGNRNSSAGSAPARTERFRSETMNRPDETTYGPAPAIDTQIKKTAPAQALPSAKLEFSSPHQMPFEKQTAPAPKPQLLAKPAPRPVFTPAPAPTPVRVPQPLRITPSGMQREFSEEPDINSLPSKNIVNLKE